jgi:hypothetical protein
MDVKRKDLKRIRDGLGLLQNYYKETNRPKKFKKVRRLLAVIEKAITTKEKCAHPER